MSSQAAPAVASQSGSTKRSSSDKWKEKNREGVLNTLAAKTKAVDYIQKIIDTLPLIDDAAVFTGCFSSFLLEKRVIHVINDLVGQSLFDIEKTVLCTDSACTQYMKGSSITVTDTHGETVSFHKGDGSAYFFAVQCGPYVCVRYAEVNVTAFIAPNMTLSFPPNGNAAEHPMIRLFADAFQVPYDNILFDKASTWSNWEQEEWASFATEGLASTSELDASQSAPDPVMRREDSTSGATDFATISVGSTLNVNLSRLLTTPVSEWKVLFCCVSVGSNQTASVFLNGSLSSLSLKDKIRSAAILARDPQLYSPSTELWRIQRQTLTPLQKCIVFNSLSGNTPYQKACYFLSIFSPLRSLEIGYRRDRHYVAAVIAKNHASDFSSAKKALLKAIAAIKEMKLQEDVHKEFRDRQRKLYPGVTDGGGRNVDSMNYEDSHQFIPEYDDPPQQFLQGQKHRTTIQAMTLIATVVATLINLNARLESESAHRRNAHD